MNKKAQYTVIFAGAFVAGILIGILDLGLLAGIGVGVAVGVSLMLVLLAAQHKRGPA
jgi:hypothetical protein